MKMSLFSFIYFENELFPHAPDL